MIRIGKRNGIVNDFAGGIYFVIYCPTIEIGTSKTANLVRSTSGQTVHTSSLPSYSFRKFKGVEVGFILCQGYENLITIQIGLTTMNG